MRVFCLRQRTDRGLFGGVDGSNDGACGGGYNNDKGDEGDDVIR